MDEIYRYKLKGIAPGVVVTRQFGKIDFSLPVPYPILDELYNSGFPYLEKEVSGSNSKKEKSISKTKLKTKRSPKI